MAGGRQGREYQAGTIKVPGKTNTQTNMETNRETAMSTTHAVEAPTAARSADGFRTRPLAPAIGAEIIGVDLSRPMSDELFAKVLETWHQSLVILFRDQDLTEDEQVRFGERF